MRDLIYRFNFKTKPWAFLLGFLVFGLFIPWFNKANAEDFKLDDLKVRFDTYVNNQPENYFRIGKDGSVNITATMRLLSPSSVNLGSDDLIYQSILDGRIVRMAIGFTPQDTSKVCREISRSPIKYLSCNSPEGLINRNKQGEVFQAASITTPLPVGDDTALMYRTTFTINAAQLAKLGVTSSSPSGTRNQILIYPMVEVSTPGLITYWGGATVTLGDGGKTLVFDYYDTQAQATAAASAGRPVDVEGYGGTTSNPKTGESGNPLLGFLNQLINAIVGLLQELLYLVFYYFIAPIIQAMLNIRTYTDVFAAVIYPGWEVVRNVCNILFIVALIAIGLGTLFRVESYQYKHLLVDLIIAALLVNFSLVIAQAVLGVADTVQSQFLPNNVEVIRSLARDLMAGWKTLTWDFAGTGYFSNTIQPLFTLALSIASFVVFSALAGFLVIRIVMLWVLLMLSPLAYAMRVLPSTKINAAKWWGEFLKYAFFTPIIAFFLNMAAVINNQYNAAFNGSGSVLQKLIDDPSLVGNSSLAAFVFRVGSNVIILVFIVIAIKAAEEAGVFGADAVAKAAKGGLLAPFKLAAVPVKFGADSGAYWFNKKKTQLSLDYLKQKHGDGTIKTWAKRAAFAALNPGAAKHALEEHKEKVMSNLEHAASARTQEIVAALPWIDRPSLAREAEVFIHAYKEKGEKETPYLSERQAYRQVKLIKDKLENGDREYENKLLYFGAVDQLIAEKGFNYMLEQEGKPISREGAIQWIQEQLDNKYLDEDQAGHLAAALSKHAYENKEYWYAEIYQVDHHGHPKIIRFDKTKGEISGKSEYEKVLADMEKYVEKKVKEEAGEGASEEDMQKIRAAQGGKIREQFLHHLEDSKDPKEKHEFAEYKNYDAFVNSIGESYNNFTKLGAREKIGFAHWSLAADIMKDGRFEMSPITARHILDATQDNDFSQSGHMNFKKKDALKKMIDYAGGFTMKTDIVKEKTLDKLGNEILVDREVKKAVLNPKVFDILMPKLREVAADRIIEKRKREGKTISSAIRNKIINAMERGEFFEGVNYKEEDDRIRTQLITYHDKLINPASDIDPKQAKAAK